MFEWLKWLKTEKDKKEGRMYDLRHCGWGHNVEFDRDGSGKEPNTHNVHGWLTPYVSKGDTFLFPATKGLAVWLFTDVKNCGDPGDMFFGTVGIIRYATEEDLKRVNEPKTEFRFV